jgi:DNA-binding MarR family transcriptional regulator
MLSRPQNLSSVGGCVNKVIRLALVEPRWLDQREERAWRGFQQMRTALTAHLARQLTLECGLTEADYAVLVTVSEAPGHRQRSRDLGRALGWDRSRLSHQISRMESRGSVRRDPCRDDGRGFDVVLTDAGLAAIEAAAPVHLAAVRHCFVDLLTRSQLDALGDIAETVTLHLTAEQAVGD